MTWCAIALVVVVPVAFNPSGYFMFLPIKWLAALVAVGSGVITLLVTKQPLPPSRLRLAWLALLAAMGLATVLSVSPATSFFGAAGRNLGLIAWLLFAGAFFLGNSLTRGELVGKVLPAAALASLPVSTYAVSQALGVDPIAWREGIDLSRARSTLGNAAFLGAYLALGVPIFARLALDHGEPTRLRQLYGVASGLGFVALLTTQTRGAWLGLISAATVALVLERHHVGERLVAAAFGGLVVLAALAVAFTPLGTRVVSIGDVGSGTARGRLIQWDLAVDMIADRPLVGWGPDTFVAVFPRYITAEFERDVGRDVLPDRAHNVLLDIAAAGGLLAVGSYGWLLATIATAAVAIARQPSPLGIGLVAGVVAYVVQALFGFPLADLDSMFWLVVGAMTAVAAGTPTQRQPMTARWPPVVAAIATGAIALFASVPAVKDVDADGKLRTALEAEADGRISAADEAFGSAASSGLVQYQEARARYDVRIAALTEDEARVNRAIADLVALSGRPGPEPEVDLDRADALLTRGEISGDRAELRQAERAYRDVLRTDPNSSRALLKLGVAVVEQGRPAEAERVWLRAARLAPRATGPLLNLATLYERQGDALAARRYYRRVLAIERDHEAARAGLERLAA